ncbi:MAG: PIG-L family deacetylase [Candidatus Marinimicrobia bacterium]|nr:PIG-L family deacetylase [candidate division WOR-3 bacterium]MCK4445842.1 PIG-L family deacetylase [Candidatus Neomarinimicrobiota bacterium]
MFRKILILAPHTDDGEFGCGASIAKFIEQGKEVYYAAFSLAEESVPPPFPQNILVSEVKAATKELGIKPENLLLYKYRVRHFAYHRQEILEDLVELNKRIKPDLVFIPCLQDLHQDHSTIAIEGLRAFKRTSILGYEIPWNNINFTTQCFITFDEKHLNKKLKALDCYNSQKGKFYASAKFIEGLARTRGTQIGVKYAEAFEVIRWIL